MQANSEIKVMIVDDEALARRGIRQLLEDEDDFRVVEEAANGSEALAAMHRLKPDVVFVDIQMPLVDGISFVKRISENSCPEVVFVTAYDEHAVSAFEAGAVDYVLKPVDPDRFRKTLTRLRRRVSAGERAAIEDKLDDLLKNLKPRNETYTQRLTIKERDRIRFVEVSDIDWIGSQGNYIEVHAGDEKHLIRETMEGIEKKLDPTGFVRIRRSTIVRVARVVELRPLFGGEFEVVLSNGMMLPSSRRYRKNLDRLLRS
jgi:two-component system, LytTR family, response regulator